MTTLTTTITIDSWDEKPTSEHDDGTKVAHAVVGLTDGNDGLGSGRMESLLYYAADGTSSYVSLLRLEGRLGESSGAFTAIGEGRYDGTTASGRMRIVEGTGELTGVSGTVTSDSTHEDYPHMPLVIDYDLG